MRCLRPSTFNSTHSVIIRWNHLRPYTLFPRQDYEFIVLVRLHKPLVVKHYTNNAANFVFTQKGGRGRTWSTKLATNLEKEGLGVDPETVSTADTVGYGRHTTGRLIHKHSSPLPVYVLPGFFRQFYNFDSPYVEATKTKKRKEVMFWPGNIF